MGTSVAVIVGLLLGTAQWNKLAERSANLLPSIFATFHHHDLYPGEREKLLQKRKDLEVYELSSIPMYYQFLKDNPKSPRVATILPIVLRNPDYSNLFMPFAIGALANKETRSNALIFLKKQGGAKQAKSVAAILLDPEFKDEDPRQVLDCLALIGSREEMAILTQYVVNQIASDPNQIWVEKANACRKAIEVRLKSEKRK